MKKYVIALIAEEETGKTSVLNNLWDLLPCYFSEDKKIHYHKPHEIIGHVELYFNDPKAIHREVNIGVNSIGDNIEQIRRGLVTLLFDECQIIICSARKIEDYIEARDTLLSTHITREMDKRGITKSFLSKAQSEINQYDLIVTSHIQKYYDPKNRKSIKRKLDDPSVPKPILIEEYIDKVNITRLSAFHILDLVERLIN